MSRWPLSTIAPTSNSLETDTHAHMFSTNAALQQEEYIPSGLWVVSLTCFLITPHCSDPSVAEDYWEVRFSVKCVLASCEDPLRFGYNMKGGGAWGDNNIMRSLSKQMLMRLVSKHTTAHLSSHATPCRCAWHSAALTKKGTSMCHRALTLQIARQAGPNYNNHTNRATHRPTWLEGASPELSNLRCCSESSIAQSACTVEGTTVSNLQPPSPGRVSSAPLIVSRTGDATMH